MSKDYISGDRLQQVYDNIVGAPFLEEETEYYMIGIKDGKLYRVSAENTYSIQTTAVKTASSKAVKSTQKKRYTTKKKAIVRKQTDDEQGVYQY